MTILLRNFLRLLRAGVFHQTEAIEPMSAWKWNQMLRLAQSHGVTALVHDGMARCKGQFAMRLTDATAARWRDVVATHEQDAAKRQAQVTDLMRQLSDQHFRPILMLGQALATLYPTPSHRRTERAVEVYYPFATQGKKADAWARQNGTQADSLGRHTLGYRWHDLSVEHHHRLVVLANKVNSRTLRQYVEHEQIDSPAAYVVIDGQRIEVITPTLALLTMLMRMAQTLLAGTTRLALLVDIGVFLRQRGDHVDYVKLQDWIAGLHMERMAQLVSALLAQLLGFTSDEMPFVQQVPELDLTPFLDDIAHSPATTRSKGAAPQRRMLALLPSRQTGTWSVRRSARYLRYYPSEGVPTMLASLVSSLSHVEE